MAPVDDAESPRSKVIGEADLELPGATPKQPPAFRELKSLAHLMRSSSIMHSSFLPGSGASGGGTLGRGGALDPSPDPGAAGSRPGAGSGGLQGPGAGAGELVGAMHGADGALGKRPFRAEGGSTDPGGAAAAAAAATAAAAVRQTQVESEAAAAAAVAAQLQLSFEIELVHVQVGDWATGRVKLEVASLPCLAICPLACSPRFCTCPIPSDQNSSPVMRRLRQHPQKLQASEYPHQAYKAVSC